MDFNMWYIFASLLLVSVGARRYDQGPQTFSYVSSDFSTGEQYGNEEVIVYLTPNQLRALEAEGAVVRTADETESEETDSELPTEAPVTEDQEEEAEQDENEPDQQEEEASEEKVQQEEEDQPEQQENPDNTEDQDIDFEDILRILNEEVEEDGEAAEEPALNEPQVEEENTESPRNFSPRIVLPQQTQEAQPKQQTQRYLAPSVAKQEVLKSYSLIRYQPNQQRQIINFQIQQQDEANDAEEASEVPQTEVTAQEKKKFKLIPYEVEETQEAEQISEEPVQATPAAEQDQRLKNFIAALKETRFSGSYGQRKNKLQSMIRQYKVSPKYLQKQNAGLKTETADKVLSPQYKQQSNKKRLQNKTKQAARGDTQSKKSQKTLASAANAKSILVPVLKNQKPKAQKSILVPVATEKRVNTKNVKPKTNKPYVISRKAPENKRQSPVEIRYLRVPRE